VQRSVRFSVPGRPQPKGSKRAFSIRRRDGSSRAVIVDDNQRKYKPWEQAIKAAAREAYDGEPTRGAVIIEAELYFSRPKSDYRTGRFAGLVKPSAPERHTKKPDVDKCARCLGDSLTGVLYVDDSQIEELWVRKAYTSGDDRTEVWVTLQESGE